jgi:ferredoxin-NAD(P)+ reductase (naphthalene dioxygenase ferredoxin-specific)
MKANAAVECCVAEAEHVTENIRILKIAPMDGAVFDWRAGQYASFQFSGCEPRDFSIANTSDAGLIELHVRRSGSGGASDAICDEVKVGDAVSVDGPYGAAYFRARHQGPIVAIAGGTGLAPMKSIVEGALSERHLIGLTREHPNFRFISVVADKTDNSGRRRGLVGDAVAADFQLLYGHQIYLAGPPAMVDACRKMLKLKSVPDHDIFTDVSPALAKVPSGSE